MCDQNGNKTSDEPQAVDENNLVEYAEMTQENLTAGTAGMVDKAFVLGNGSDNINYRNQFATAAVSKLTSNAVSTFSINVSGLVPDYQDLTADNFICEFENYTVTSSPGNIAYDSSGTEYVNQTNIINKTYDAATGSFAASIATTSVVARTSGCYLYMEYQQKQGQNAYGRVTVGGSAKFNVYLVIY